MNQFIDLNLNLDSLELMFRLVFSMKYWFVKAHTKLH